MAAVEDDDAFSDTSSVYSDASSAISETDGSSTRSTKIKKKLITSTTLGGIEVETVSRKKGRRKKKRASVTVGRAPSAADLDEFDVKDWKVLGFGEFGIEEMADALPDGDKTVIFGIVSITVGTGKFARTKSLFVNFIGRCCPGAMKGKAIQKQSMAHAILGETHTSITFESRSEVTTANVFEQVGKLFVSDDLDCESRFAESWSLEQIQIMYQKEIAKKREEYQAQVLEELPIPPKVDRIQEILNLIHEDMGWVNWVLFKPTQKKLKLLSEESFGGGTIYAMRQHLDPDKILFGLLRMSFGIVPYRRNHFVMLQWIGPNVKRIKRGKQVAKRPQMYELLQPHNIQIELANLEEVTVENIINRVREIVVVDGGEDEAAEIQEAKLIEEFEKALAEEEAANSLREKVLSADKPPEQLTLASPTTMTEETKLADVEDYIDHSSKVLDEASEVNWMLIEFQKKRKTRRGKRKKKT